MKTKIYIHIATMRHFNKVLSKLLDEINLCGLYNKAEEINLNVCGDGSLLDIKKMPKYNITNETHDFKKCEFPTLDKIWEDSQKEKFKVLYLHTKGITHDENDKYFTNWIRHLSYFNIEKWEDRIKNLDKYDTSGLNYIKNPKGNKNKLVRQSIRMLEKSSGYHRAKHYAGNFWWANSHHIKKLKKPSDLVLCGNYLKRRWIAEFWIGGKKPNAYTEYVDFANFIK